MLIDLFAYQDLSLLIVRIALALIFLVHGFGKIKDIKATVSGFEMMGFKPGNLWGPLVAFGEIIGGLSLLMGFYFQYGAMLLAVIMLVALIWKIMKGQSLVGGFEFDLILLSTLLLLATVPAGGLYSLDAYYLQVS